MKIVYCVISLFYFDRVMQQKECKCFTQGKDNGA